MYANSRFMKTVNEWGGVTEWINPGDEISQSDLQGCSDKEWQSLIDSGAVVESYPKDLDPSTPPAEYYKQNPEEAPAGIDVSAAAGGDLSGEGVTSSGETTGGKQSDEETKKAVWQK